MISYLEVRDLRLVAASAVEDTAAAEEPAFEEIAVPVFEAAATEDLVFLSAATVTTAAGARGARTACCWTPPKDFLFGFDC